MNVLAIGCHPGDIEINCAGTLAKCVKRGDNVTVCHVCDCNMGHVVIQPDNLGGNEFLPTEYVDITDEIDLKLEMLECHESQIKWMREHENIDFADMVKTISKYCGYQCGAAYAEAFSQCMVYPKTTTRRMLQ